MITVYNYKILSIFNNNPQQKNRSPLFSLGKMRHAKSRKNIIFHILEKLNPTDNQGIPAFSIFAKKRSLRRDLGFRKYWLTIKYVRISFKIVYSILFQRYLYQWSEYPNKISRRPFPTDLKNISLQLPLPPFPKNFCERPFPTLPFLFFRCRETNRKKVSPQKRLAAGDREIRKPRVNCA